MGTFGGRGAMARACAPLALLLALPLTLSTGCSGALDQAHTVQTKLNRIGAVTESQVSTPSADTGADIEVTYNGDPTVRQLAALIKEIDRVADGEDYPSYRLDLVPAEHSEDRLTADDTLAGGDDEAAVLGNWLAVTSALLGAVDYRFEPGDELIDVDSGAGIVHDVGEASRIHYGFPGTVWTFHDGNSSFSASGQVSPTDVALFQSTQRTVTSQALPLPAATWRLDRRQGHLLLDLDLQFAGGSVPPALLTVKRYGDDVARTASAAMGAARVESLPVTMRLINPTPDGDDVFGYWTSDRRPVRGRDRLMRGWDLWLHHLGQSLQAQPGSAT